MVYKTHKILYWTKDRLSYAICTHNQIFIIIYTHENGHKRQKQIRATIGKLLTCFEGGQGKATQYQHIYGRYKSTTAAP